MNKILKVMGFLLIVLVALPRGCETMDYLGQPQTPEEKEYLLNQLRTSSKSPSEMERIDDFGNRIGASAAEETAPSLFRFDLPTAYFLSFVLMFVGAFGLFTNSRGFLLYLCIFGILVNLVVEAYEVICSSMGLEYLIYISIALSIELIVFATVVINLIICGGREKS